MNIIDISWPIAPGMTEYKNRASVHLKKIKNVLDNGAAESEICLHSHTGTHIDAPSHFLSDGKTIENVSLDSLIGTCRVIDLTHVDDAITRQDIEAHIVNAGERILLKTKNSARSISEPFDPSFIYLRADAARFLVDKKIKTIGIDYLGIERNQPKHDTHELLMKADITIIEGLRLQGVSAGNYELYCLPLLIPGIDAAPARAILMK
ncbi:MAG TPA: cyclase family protein [Candidatus Babeliales bacterium]|nr:cyclase family protein [Candidatus Babeliales bacterium]